MQKKRSRNNNAKDVKDEYNSLTSMHIITRVVLIYIKNNLRIFKLAVFVLRAYLSLPRVLYVSLHLISRKAKL